MKKNIRRTLMITLLAATLAFTADKPSIHSLTAETIDGEKFSFADLKGKKVLVVNVASKCGLTPQYEKLQELYEKYGGEHFEIVAFPANNFMGQEPGTEAEIKTFCSLNYGVTFTMMSKISVKGDDMDPIYQWLTQKDMNGVMDTDVKWNFQKYMIDEEGRLVDYLSPRESPMSDKVISWLEGK